MAKNWIVVANNAAAQIFSAEISSSKLKVVERLDHPEGRKRAGDMDADRPGRSFQTAGNMRHGVQRQVDAKKQANMEFAQRVAHRLDSARRQGEMERLVLVAAPEFLGLLRNVLTPETKRLVESEFNLDLAAMKPNEIRDHLPEKLFSTVVSR